MEQIKDEHENLPKFPSQYCLRLFFYILDVYTDIKFSLNMFKEFSRNYTYTIETCHRTLVNNLRSALTVGNSSSFTDCLEICLNTGQRFQDPKEWWRAGLVSAIHCALPYLFAIIFWITIEMGQLEKTCFFRLPIPPLTKLYKTKIDQHLFNQFIVSKRMDDVK